MLSFLGGVKCFTKSKKHGEVGTRVEGDKICGGLEVLEAGRGDRFLGL